MTKYKSLMWMGKVIIVLITFLSGVLYADGTEILENRNINGTDNILLFCGKGQCKHGVHFPLGIGKETFFIRSCSRDSGCEKYEKCANSTGAFTKLCARKCDVDDDCEYPTKCIGKEKYCFWEKCKSNDDCQNSLTCSHPPYFREKLCSRESCTTGHDSECKDNQICHPKARACQCANGMSGKECEVAEWCEDNGKFKDCKGVNGTCAYNKSERAIKCICANGKKFHPEENRCRETCDNGADCKNDGVCTKKGDYKFCSCKLGVIGEKCEIVFDCTSDGKYKDCESSGGKCFYDGTKAICECPGDKKLNDKQFICEACICRGGECVIEEGKKVCKCPPGYGNFTASSCRVCDCGPDTNCIWEARFGGSKVCLCNPGYSTKNGKCVACDCGPDSNCEWISDGWLKPEKKVCHCKPGYHDENGKCVDISTISSSGTTESSTISTILSSTKQDNDTTSSRGTTKPSTISTNPSSTKQDIKTTSSRGTTEPFTISTILSSTEKDCHCGTFSYSCSLDSAGNQVCGCFKAYSQLDGSCKECNCGPYGTCNFEHGRKKCICKSFATERNGVCVDKQDLRKIFQVSFTYNIFL